MKAIVDADIICYEFGDMKDLETGELLAWPIVRSLVDDRIQQINEAVNATESVYYLTDSKSNFRNKVATILPYKGNRPDDKPPHWEEIRQHLIDNYDAQVQYGIEADDACGIEQYEDFKNSGHYIGPYPDRDSEWIHDDTLCETIICSRDKDLNMIPGWHYSWECGKQKEKKWFVSEEEGIRFFYKQLLTGDATDNILGLFRVGEKASCVKALDDMTDEYNMYCHVRSEYESRFGSYAWEFLLENARLLWILKDNKCKSQDPSQEILQRLWEHEKVIRSSDEEVSKTDGNEASVQNESCKGQDKV